MLVPLVLVLALHAEPNEAEKLFRDMEKKVTSAKSLECALEGKISGANNLSIKGSLAFEEGNKTHLEMNNDFAGKATTYTIISDGTKMQASVDGKSQGKQDTPKELGEARKVMFARAGLLVPFFSFSAGPPDKADKELKVDDLFKVADFKLGKKEKIGDHEAQEIQYTLTTKTTKEPLTVHLWIDTKTNLPLKRVFTVPMGDNKGTMTETYSKLILDGKIDPKKFELPK
jgi:outer membrane lipoprotein-sorting protein